MVIYDVTVMQTFETAEEEMLETFQRIVHRRFLLKQEATHCFVSIPVANSASLVVFNGCNCIFSSSER